MKDRNYITTYVVMLLAGVLLTVFCGSIHIFKIILIIVGVLFIVPGLWAVIGALMKHKNAQEPHAHLATAMTVTTGVAGIIFGVLLVCMPMFFATFLVYVFGALLIVCGLLQIANMWVLLVMPRVRTWYLVVPVLSIGAGIYLIANGPHAAQTLICLVTGIALMVWAVNGLTGYFNQGRKAVAQLEQHHEEEKEEDKTETI